MSKKGRIGDRYRKVKISKEIVKVQNKKQYAKIAILALFLFVVTLGGSYAIFTMTISGKKTTEVISGTLTIEYLDKNEINLNNSYPMSNEEGLNTTPYTFTIKNTGTLNGKYTISIEEKENNTLDKNHIKYAIREKDGEWSSPTLLSSGLILKENVIIESQKETTYELKMWLDENAPNEVQGKTYSGKIVVNTVQTNSNEITTTSPIIELNGEKVVTINENETYIDAGVNKIISNDNLSIENITTRYEYFDGTNTQEVESIDTSKIGSYYIYYEIKDSRNNIGITSRVVNVKKKDTNIPTITLKGESLVSLEYNEEYIEPGYTASDIEDGNLTDKVVVIGTVNKEVSGTYVIKYIVTDSYGNTSSVTREVIVNEKSGTINLETITEENENLTAEILIEAETENEKMYYAVTTSNEKPNDSEYKEMDLVTSLSNTKNIRPSKLTNTKETEITKLSSLKKFRKIVEVVKNGTYYVYIKDNKENIESKSVKITNIDETKPSCEFSKDIYVGKDNDINIILTCTDPADITNEKITKDYFEIGNRNILDIEIGESTKIENGYQYKINVIGKESGTTNIKLLSNKISDQVGNKNDLLSKEIKVTNIEVDSSEVKLDLSGVSTHQIEVSGTNEGNISYKSSNENIASVTTTGIITGVSPGSTTIIVEEENGKVQKEIRVIVVKTLTALYEKQGTGVTAIGSTKSKCEVVDESGKCSVILPSITVTNGYSVVGWNEDNTATTGTAVDIEIYLTKNTTTYYTISRKDEVTLTATFNKNGATSLDGDTSDYITKQCNIPGTYNGIAQASGCDITSPVINASTTTPTVTGYSTEPTNHNSIWSSNETKSILESANYYAQTKKDEITYTATFEIGKNVQSIGKENESCTIAEVYNGTVQDTSCSVEGPSITAKTGYTSVGWSTTNGSTTGSTSLELTEDTTFYANATANSYTVEYYDGTTKLGSSGVKVDEELTLTTIATLNGEKVGYTFKGWSTTSGSTTVAYTDGKIVSNLSTTEGAIVKLYAVFVDDIKPICSFSSTKEIYVTEEDTLTLTCTDLGSGLSNTSLKTNNFEVSNSNGDIVSVSTPTVITNGYQYTVTIKGLSSGTTIDTNGLFTISLKENSIIDNSSNGNIKTTSQTEIVKGLTYTQSYTTSIGVESITSTQTSCTTILTNLTCDITLPGISASEGYTQDGWYNNTTKVGEQNTSYTLTSSNNNQTLTAKAIDDIAPTWSISQVSTTSLTTMDTVSIEITGKDLGSGYASSSLSNSNISYNVGGNSVTATKTTLTKISSTSTSVVYKLTLEMLGGSGSFVLNIGEGTLLDNASNGNNAISLSTGITVSKNTKLKILVWKDYNENATTLLNQYYSNVTHDESLTTDDIITNNYDAVIYYWSYWGVSSSVNTLFSNGINLVTCGNDSTDSLDIVSSYEYVSSNGNSTMQINNELTNYLPATLSRQEDGQNIVRFNSSATIIYKNIYNNTEYDNVGYLTANGATWLHIQQIWSPDIYWIPMVRFVTGTL